MPRARPLSALPAPRGARRVGRVLLGAGAFVLLAAAGYVLAALAHLPADDGRRNGLVSLGIVALMRGGVVPFGQGMVFAAGGYAAALPTTSSASPTRSAWRSLGGVAAAARRRAVRAAAVALPRHLLRDADAGAVDGRPTAC